MSGHSTYQPQSAFMRWFERRLPIAGLVHSSFIAYPTPRNLNYWWTFGAILDVHARRADRHRHRAGDALHAACRLWRSIPSRRSCATSTTAGCCATCTANGASMFFVAVYIHIVPRHVLRLLQGAARGAVDPRRHPVPADDGDRLHGLRAAVGPDELLGGDRHHQPVLGDPAGRRPDRHLAVGRLCGRQSDAQPLLLAALPPAVRHRRRRRAAHLGAAHGRAEQSDRRRAARPRRTRSRSRPTRPSRMFSSPACSVCSSPGSCSTSRIISAIPTTTFPPIPGRRRRISCRNGTTCRSTPSCAPSRTSSSASSRSAARSSCSPSCPGSIPRGCARPSIGRSTGNFFSIFFAVVIGLGYLGSQPPEGGYVIAARILTAYYFVFLLDHPAAARPVRDDEAVAQFDLGIGVARRRSRRRVGAAALGRKA